MWLLQLLLLLLLRGCLAGWFFDAGKQCLSPGPFPRLLAAVLDVGAPAAVTTATSRIVLHAEVLRLVRVLDVDVPDIGNILKLSGEESSEGVHVLAQTVQQRLHIRDAITKPINRITFPTSLITAV